MAACGRLTDLFSRRTRMPTSAMRFNGRLELFVMRDLRKLFTENAEQFDSLMTEMLSDNELLQAKIDALMFEYCPDEMTPEQIENWKQHQRKAELQYELDSYGPS